MDRKEEKQYDIIVTREEGKIIFDTPDSLHYLTYKGIGIFFSRGTDKKD